MDTRHVMDFRPNFTTLKNSYAGAPTLVAGARRSRGNVRGFLLPYFLNCLRNKFTVARPCHAAILPPVVRKVTAAGPSDREAKGGDLRPDRVAGRWDKFRAFRVWWLSSTIRSRPLPLVRSDSDGSCSITNPPDAPPRRVDGLSGVTPSN